MRTSKIILYDEPTVPEIQLEKIARSLKNKFPVKIETRHNFFQHSDKTMLAEIARTRIVDLKKPFKEHIPTDIEISIEKENKDMSGEEEIPIYDGFELQKMIAGHISRNESRMDILHVVCTNKLTCTFDESDFRYHARPLIGSNPAIISTTGMIEGPAMPKQYYLDLMTNFSNEDVEEIKKKYNGGYLERHDYRTSGITERYILQTIVYYETGEAFCKHRYCSLFNAHWQKDLFHTQMKNKKFCEKHLKILKELKN